MFETVAPETFQARSRRVAYEALPLSIALHAIAIGVAVVVAVWNVVFPAQSPRLVLAYSLGTIPDPLPPPPRPPAGKVAPRHEVPKPVAPPLQQFGAPRVLPDFIRQLPDA